MLFEEHLPVPVGYRNDRAQKLGDGLLHGQRDVWVVVAREGIDLADWLLPAGGTLGSALRVCSEVREDGTLVLETTDPFEDDPRTALLDFE
jgi:hypothetical protein